MTISLPATVRCASLDEFKTMQASRARIDAAHRAHEAALLGAETFTVPGVCAVCDREAGFAVDYAYAAIPPHGPRIPNWRERLVCPTCHLNNRQRAAAAFLLSATDHDDSIYLTEAVTGPALAIMARRPNTIGSEFLRDGTAPGARNQAGIRHEDATRLTVPSDGFTAIGTFDVLEHIPDYRAALTEFFRCLKPNGTLYVTVPFNLHAPNTLVRATMDAHGVIHHLLEPEIHGDPLSDTGALCFYHFGWDLVSDLSKAGFADAGLCFFWSARLGYLGPDQFVIAARKP